MGYRPKSVKRKTLTANRMTYPRTILSLFYRIVREGSRDQVERHWPSSLLLLGEKTDPHNARATGRVDYACDFGEIEIVGRVDEQHSVGASGE